MQGMGVSVRRRLILKIVRVVAPFEDDDSFAIEPVADSCRGINSFIFVLIFLPSICVVAEWVDEVQCELKSRCRN